MSAVIEFGVTPTPIISIYAAPPKNSAVKLLLVPIRPLSVIFVIYESNVGTSWTPRISESKNKRSSPNVKSEISKFPRP